MGKGILDLIKRCDHRPVVCYAFLLLLVRICPREVEQSFVHDAVSCAIIIVLACFSMAYAEKCKLEKSVWMKILTVLFGCLAVGLFVVLLCCWNIVLEFLSTSPDFVVPLWLFPFFMILLAVGIAFAFYAKTYQRKQQERRFVEIIKQDASEMAGEKMLAENAIVKNLKDYSRKGLTMPTASEWCELMTKVEELLPQFNGMMKECDLSDLEVKICILTRLDFTPTEMSLLMGISRQSVTNQRSALNKKMFGADSARTFKKNIIVYSSKSNSSRSS